MASKRAPNRCVAGLVRLGPRCCGAGQSLAFARCVGEPTRCGGSLEMTKDGCVAPERTVAIAGASLKPSSGDWGAPPPEGPAIDVAPFRIDAFEVTWSRFGRCVGASSCDALAKGTDDPSPEPGLPVTGITSAEAARFCAFVGGALPSSAELRLAAGGAEGRKFPWGQTGAVCRKAAWGLTAGPCAHGGVAELAGSRPEGKSPEGAEDLAGNVAEWTAPREDGTAEVRGGSFSDADASRLTSAASRIVPADTRAPDIGFRCIYRP